MPISGVGGSAGLPPLPAVITPQVSTTDSAQALSVDRNVICIRGDAAGSSRASLTIEGKPVSVELQAGMRAYDTFKALQSQVPPGYELRTLQEVRGTVFAEIIARPVAAPPGAQSSQPLPPGARSDAFDGHQSRPDTQPVGVASAPPPQGSPAKPGDWLP